jgi:riboflavin kinase / FMN adenylyltransferase
MNRIADQKNGEGGVIALGNFDGVHRGHQAVARAAIEAARGQGIASHVLTFEPHPRAVLQPGIGPFRLTSARAKERLLKKLGIDSVVALPFTPEFSTLSAEDFVRKILVAQFKVKHIVAGVDYVFGHKRGGTMPLLRQWLAPYGVGVAEVAPLLDAGGLALSSSHIRDALRRGDLKTAAQSLGRDWSIAGIVEHGAKRGASIGVPTANIALGDYLRPKFGVYAVIARRVKDGSEYKGVANIGTRPTVDGKSETLEAHLFDFDQTIYGEEWEFDLIDFIRPERAFDGIGSLQEQIVKDIQTAKAKFT